MREVVDFARDRAPAKRKLLLVASTGGHLWELRRLAVRLGAADDSLWVTFDTADSRSLLEGKRVLHIPYVAPRDFRGMVRGIRPIRQALRRESFDGVISTGAAVAVSAMLAALGRVADRTFVESVCRFRGPSLTGRMIAAARLARTMTQHAGWSGPRWPYIGSVLKDYASAERPSAPAEITRVFVTVGTIRPYGFRRLLDRVSAILPDSVEVVWQVGVTPADGLRGEVVPFMDGERFAAEVAKADVVVTHSGIATVLGLLDRGVFPVVVPRERARGEHVDEHQTQAAEAFGAMGLAVSRRVPELTWADLQAAAQRSVVPAA